jgi:putative membrane protein insertion efficiency factor
MMNRFFIWLIKLYQKILSPHLGQNCRFYPTCSHYAVLSYKNYNFFKATYLMLWRILRCNPFSKGGEDFPPHLNQKDRHGF